MIVNELNVKRDKKNFIVVENDNAAQKRQTVQTEEAPKRAECNWTGEVPAVANTTAEHERSLARKAA